MQFTRTPSTAASAEVNRMSPAFAAPYSGDRYGSEPRPAVEATLTIAPPPARRIGARASCVASIGARRLRSSVAPHWSGDAAGKCGGM